MRKPDGLVYVNALTKSLELLLGQLDSHLDALQKTEDGAALPQDLLETSQELKLVFGRFQEQLQRAELDADGPGSSTTCDGHDSESSGEKAEDKGATKSSEEESIRSSSAVDIQQALDAAKGRAKDVLSERKLEVEPAVVGKRVETNQRDFQRSDGGACIPQSLLCPGMGFSFLGEQGHRRKSDWTEHTDPASGATYYYNSVSRESTWTRPATLQSRAKPPALEETPLTTIVSDGVSVRSGRSTKSHRSAGEKSSKSGASGNKTGADDDGGGGGGNGVLTVAEFQDDVPEEVLFSKSEPMRLIDPTWTSKLTWDFGVMFVVLVDSLVLPFQLAFKNQSPTDGFDEFWFALTTTLFFTDIIFTFNTAIEIEDDGSNSDTLITDRKIIAKTYIWGWFWIDFISTIPWARMVQALAGAGSSAQAAKLLKVMKFLRLIRLMRMLRMAKLRAIWERVEDEMGSVLLVQSVALFRILMMVIAICHWNACLWWMIGCQESLITDMLPDTVSEAFQASPHWTTTYRSIGPQTEPFRWVDKPTEEAYVFCFYWTLGVMRTMPAEVSPVNLPERIFVLIFMFFALSAFAISVASLTQAFFKISERNKSFTDELFAVRMQLKKLQVDKVTRRHVKDYLTHMFDRRRINAKETNLMNSLPAILKDAVQRARQRMHLNKLTSVLEELSPEMKEELCGIAQFCDVLPGDLLCTAGDESTAAWVLCAGKLQAKNAAGENVTLTHPLDHVVDEHCLFSAEPTRSQFTMTAFTVSEILKIDKQKFIGMLGQENDMLARRRVATGPFTPAYKKSATAEVDANADSASAAAAAISAG